MGVLHEIQKLNPNKELYLLDEALICPNMKKTTLENIYECLNNNKNEIVLNNDIIERARGSLDKMLAI